MNPEGWTVFKAWAEKSSGSTSLYLLAQTAAPVHNYSLHFKHPLWGVRS